MNIKHLTEQEQLERLEQIINQALTEQVYMKHPSGKKIAMDKFILN